MCSATAILARPARAARNAELFATLSASIVNVQNDGLASAPGTLLSRYVDVRDDGVTMSCDDTFEIAPLHFF